jgi:DNA-binding CsgD family transcriptional regulator
MKSAHALAHIRQLSCLGLPGESVMPKLLKAIRELVGADSAGFFWVDARGDMKDLYAERVLPASLMQRYFECHYDGPEMSFRDAFQQRARATEPVMSYSADNALQRTAYYNEILRHLDAHHILYAIIRDQGSPLGQLSLYRPKTDEAFSNADRTALASVRRYVAHAIDCVPLPATLNAGYLDTDDEGMVLVDQQGRIVQAGSRALLLLTRACGVTLNPTEGMLTPGQKVPEVARALVKDLIALMRNQAVTPPANIRDTAWGRFTLRAYLLGDRSDDPGSLVGLQVKRLESMVLRLTEAMHHLQLSPQQREVALLLAQGRSNPEIADALNVSRNTAIYHIKQLFTRLDAHDRSEALSRILGRAAPE